MTKEHAEKRLRDVEERIADLKATMSSENEKAVKRRIEIYNNEKDMLVGIINE